MASRAAMTLSEVKERTRDLTERYGLSVDLPVRALLLALHDAVACAEEGETLRTAARDLAAEWDQTASIYRIDDLHGAANRLRHIIGEGGSR